MKQHKIGIIYNEPLPRGAENWESSQDVLVQVEAIEKALNELKHKPVSIPFSGDLQASVARICAERLDVAINLCESVNEDPRLIGHPAAVLELLGIPFSGSPAQALMLTTDKLVSKLMLVAQGITTPKYIFVENIDDCQKGNLKYPVIIKPRFQDASIGIDQDSICPHKRELPGKVKRFLAQYGPLIVEEYIPGEEYNISLMGFPRPTLLPYAKIDFSGLPDGLMPIVGYKAKWDKDSVEYQQTKRVFPKRLPPFFFNAIKTIATYCFRTFMLRDYGRVDFRIDERGRIYVLEINANPCLSPDAGFAAAAQQDNIPYSRLIEILVNLIFKRKKLHDSYQADLAG